MIVFLTGITHSDCCWTIIILTLLALAITAMHTMTEEENNRMRK